ncbi:MAG: alcohol dehydrogenase catalytic domain-containing protein [Pirellulales bacterium]|nr:alcohol dehydrogenase catalytic domain-containing protein [Pirellulales bacterium]
MTKFPTSQHAVQLIGPDKLALNTSKPVPTPGPHEILLQVEAVGLCFSDLKLLKQFDSHPRKSDVVSGIDQDILASIQSYVPNDKPVVPGHEAVCHIVAVGDQVEHHQVGERCLVQTDYRQLPTASSNAAFGYNFEGALQEYTLVDERVVIDTDGERFLIPAGSKKSASAVALVEPWACVEDSYVNKERNHIKADGRLLVVLDEGREAVGLQESMTDPPAEMQTAEPADVGGLPDDTYDDIVYYGSDKQTIELLNDKLTTMGIINIVLDGETIGELVSVGVGRVHYGMTRWIGTTGNDASKSYEVIPADGEIRPQDKVLVVGAGGPMGQMHVIRNICLGIPGISVVGADHHDNRIESLLTKVEPLAKTNGVPLRLVNTHRNPIEESFSYFALMAPLGELVASAIDAAEEGAIINIFAGIPAGTKHELDLDRYIGQRCFMFGTSGSTIEDMRIVLGKLEADQLDTNSSVDAISGIHGAIEGIACVENRSLAGKIIVYPMLHDLGLIPLAELPKHFPEVAAKLDDGKWTLAAEQELLRQHTSA